MTFGQFDALLERRKEGEKRDWMRVGTIAAAVINFSSVHPEERVSMMDFVPYREKEEDDLTKMTPEQQAARIMSKLTKKDITRR